MNLYKWLNARHQARMLAGISKRISEISEIGEADHSKWMTAEEMELHWAEKEARRAARPLLVNKTEETWWAASRFARDHTPRRMLNSMVWFIQRGRRGWADSDAWSLDSYNARVLSQMMQHLAETTECWPGEGSQWPAFEDWQMHLIDLAGRLGAWDVATFADKDKFEITRQAMMELAGNFGKYWD